MERVRDIHERANRLGRMYNHEATRNMEYFDLLSNKLFSLRLHIRQRQQYPGSMAVTAIVSLTQAQYNTLLILHKSCEIIIGAISGKG